MERRPAPGYQLKARGDVGGTHGNEFPPALRTDISQLGKRLSAGDSVGTSLVEVDAGSRVLRLRRETGVLKGNVDEVDALLWRQQVTCHARQDCAVQTTREEYRDSRVVSCIKGWRLWYVQDTQLERFSQLISQRLDRWRDRSERRDV